MSARVKYGLIVGAIGLVLNICVSAAFGFCGPLVALLAGTVAGFFAAQAERASIRTEAARRSGTSGAIAAALTFVGQMIGGIGILLFIQLSGTPTAFGTLPESTDTASQIGYWAGGLGVGICFGLLGILLGAGGGALAGYFGTPAQPTTIIQE